ncbi:MAG TPA: hypothetical protein VKB36_07875 [Vicinamibacterales bacterium]|nr:hypothetical protein [Vicinamibacterales bacterium]
MTFPQRRASADFQVEVVRRSATSDIYSWASGERKHILFIECKVEMRMGGPSADITLRVAKLAALFCSLMAAAYAALQIQPSPIMRILVTSGPAVVVVLWLQKDARRTGVGAVQDFGYFLWLAWPFVIPWYAFRTRGRSGWKLTAGLFGLIMASYITWFVVAYGLWSVRYGLWYLGVAN